MTIALKPDATYALLAPTSMGVRLTPENAQPFHAGERFLMQVTSAETNVASISSLLGLPVKVLTALVEGSPVARMIRDDLLKRHMDVEAAMVPQGDPWGYRHQFNLADSGLGVRGPRVHNDRAGEVGRALDVEDFDLERIFGTEGVAMMHLSGLIAALSPETSRFCVELARTAQRHGTRISFDLNHRASFWQGREAELHEQFAEISSLADVLIGNEEDFQLCLGVEGPEAGGTNLAGELDGFKGMIERAKQAYPNVSVFATTLREVVHANLHRWGAVLAEGDRWHVVEPREIAVLDRIGGGDGFVGGMLYAILRGWESDTWVRFGWATGALATTFLTDYANVADEDQVWSAWEGNARVKR